MKPLRRSSSSAATVGASADFVRLGGVQIYSKQTTKQAKTRKKKKKPVVPEGELITVGAPTRIISLELMQGEVGGRAALRAKDKTLSQLSRIKGRMKTIF